MERKKKQPIFSVKCGREKILDFFQHLGLPCRELAQGRMYPCSLQAASVLDTLRIALTDTGIPICCDFFVKDLKPNNGYFQIIGNPDKFSKQNRSFYVPAEKLHLPLAEMVLDWSWPEN